MANDKDSIIHLRELVGALPPFCREFFRGIEPQTSIRTRVAYAYDLRVFFRFLTTEIAVFKNIPFDEFMITELERVTLTHLEMYMEYLNYYVSEENNEWQNNERGKARKLATVRSFFKYFYQKEKISKNVASLISLPKIHEKPIIRLDANEVAELLDQIEQGENLSATQKRFHAHTKIRDVAIITLFLGTGIRISELVGVNVSDVDLSANSFKVTRKGGNQVVLYFGQETRDALVQYLNERGAITPAPEHEDALFLSLQRKRISARAIQILVKKYAAAAAPLKKISPHKLRSTYGTMLYRETGDIYLVADVLGHKDVNTTKKHYAAIDEDKRRLAAKMVKLRED